MKVLLLCLVVFLSLSQSTSYAALSPNEVVVVYNSHSYWSPVSEAVANYYCSARGIPESNKLAVSIPIQGETMSPAQFRQYIMEDQDTQPGLKSFLQSLGSNPNDPSSDPIKCIVLCYGVPLKIRGNERSCSVDSALALLFNSTQWGREPIGAYAFTQLYNPYYCYNLNNPLDRRGKPADFGEFRASCYTSVPHSQS